MILNNITILFYLIEVVFNEILMILNYSYMQFYNTAICFY